MNPNLLPDIQRGLGELFTLSPHQQLMRVRTPFWYPDGGVIDVFVGEHDNNFTVTDLGESLGWLRMQSPSGKRSPKQQKLVQDVCLTQGVELFKGQLLLRCTEPAGLSSCIVRLGQAMLRVADLWFTTRTRSVESMTDEVADYLQDRQISFERGVKLSGRSGRDWQVDFQTRTPSQSALVFVLATGSRAAARRVTEHVVAGWHDLILFKSGAVPTKFLSLFDDTNDVWADEDFKLVESVSEICRWSQPDDFNRQIGLAA